MNKYKLTAQFSEHIKLIDLNTKKEYRILLNINRRQYFRKIIRTERRYINEMFINFKSELLSEKIIEILTSEDEVISNMFLDIIKNKKL
jgi:hypothetical protein